MKKKIAIFLTFLMLFTNTSAYVDNLVKIDVEFNRALINVNGELISIGNLLYDSRTYIQLRDVAETLNKEVEWNQSTMTANIYDTDEKIERTYREKQEKVFDSINVQFDAITVYVNGEKSNATNLLHEGITYVQLRDLSEILGLEVDWEVETSTAFINDKDEKTVKPETSTSSEISTSESTTTTESTTTKVAQDEVKKYENFPQVPDYGAMYKIAVFEEEEYIDSDYSEAIYIYTDNIKVADIKSYVSTLLSLGFKEDQDMANDFKELQKSAENTYGILHYGGYILTTKKDITSVGVAAFDCIKLIRAENNDELAGYTDEELLQMIREEYGANIGRNVLMIAIEHEKI